MVRACLTPCSSAMQHCINWLEQYFQDNGDHIPNSDETRVNVLVRDLYQSYQRSCEYKKLRFVGYPTFSNNWKYFFPNCTRRPYVDIPGKCSTCFEIDRLRKTVESEEVQKLLAEAHYLHRGGLFMLERKE